MPCLFVKWTKISKQAWTEIWPRNQLYFFFLQSSKDLTRKFAELGLSCKLPLEEKKKSLEDAPNCDIMPLSQNNIEWSSYLALTSWIRVLDLIVNYCHIQVALANSRRKLPPRYSKFQNCTKVFSLFHNAVEGNLHINCTWILYNCILITCIFQVNLSDWYLQKYRNG